MGGWVGGWVTLSIIAKSLMRWVAEMSKSGSSSWWSSSPMEKVEEVDLPLFLDRWDG